MNHSEGTLATCLKLDVCNAVGKRTRKATAAVLNYNDRSSLDGYRDDAFLKKAANLALRFVQLLGISLSMRITSTFGEGVVCVVYIAP
jgi:hypothetical protein